MNKEQILELALQHGFDFYLSRILAFAKALTEPLEKEIAGLEDRHRVALFRLDKADNLALQRLNSMAKLSSRIAELEALGRIVPVKPMTGGEIWKDENIVAANSDYGASFETLREVIRAVEAHHGIGGKV